MATCVPALTAASRWLSVPSAGSTLSGQTNQKLILQFTTFFQGGQDFQGLEGREGAFIFCDVLRVMEISRDISNSYTPRVETIDLLYFHSLQISGLQSSVDTDFSDIN